MQMVSIKKATHNLGKWIFGSNLFTRKKTVITAFMALITLMSMTTKPEPTIFKVEVSKSTFKWTGKKVAGTHWGYVKFSDGNLQIKNGVLVGGIFNMDMTTIDCQDTQGEWGEKLVGHLKSDDFFNANGFPKATLVIKSATAKGNNQYDVVADLSIKGKTNEVKFLSTVLISGQTASATANFDVDRTRYGIKYGSGSFFDNLGDKAIENNFNIDVNLVAFADVPAPAKKKAAKRGKPASN
jgi:polyisoprenoid-binding protein YceI